MYPLLVKELTSTQPYYRTHFTQQSKTFYNSKCRLLFFHECTIFYRNLKRILGLSISVYCFKYLFQLLAIYGVMVFTQLH